VSHLNIYDDLLDSIQYWTHAREIVCHHSLHNACPQYLSSLQHTYTPTRQLRSTSHNLLSLPRVKIAFASRGFQHTGPSIWHSLPPHLRSIDTYTSFKSNLKTHLFCSASISGP